MTDEDQRRRFEDAARDLECDESEERFERALKRIVKPPKQSEESDS